jgi:hypothetical protein
MGDEGGVGQICRWDSDCSRRECGADCSRRMPMRLLFKFNTEGDKSGSSKFRGQEWTLDQVRAEVEAASDHGQERENEDPTCESTRSFIWSFGVTRTC